MLKILKISGHSLEPEYRVGDYVFVSKIPFFFRPLRRGDIVAFYKDPYGLLIKRVEYLTQAGEVFVLGSHVSSVDSLQFGPVRKRDLLGVVIKHISNPGMS